MWNWPIAKRLKVEALLFVIVVAGMVLLVSTGALEEMLNAAESTNHHE